MRRHLDREQAESAERTGAHRLPATQSPDAASSLLRLQREVGNRTVAGMMAPVQRQTAPSATATDEGTHTGSGASGVNTGWDSAVRMRSYVDESRRISQQLLDDVDAGRLTHQQARQLAQTLRNQALLDTREQLTPGGRAVSEAIKEEGKSLPELVETYSRRIVRQNPARFGLRPQDLADEALVARAARTIESSDEVSRAIISAAGRTNRAMTVVARVGRVAGPVGAAASLAMSGYEIVNAEPGVDTARVAAREAGGFAGGWVGATAGGLAAGWTASLLCGPGAAVCALVVTVVIVGGAAYGGGRAGEWTSQAVFDAIIRVPGAMTEAAATMLSGAGAVMSGAQAVGNALREGLFHAIATGYGMLDPVNWQLDPALPARTRADLSVLGMSLWARVRPGSPWARRTGTQTQLDAFLANTGRPLSEYAVPRELVASIAAECRRTTQARDGRPVDITADALLATSPAGVVTFLRDCGLLTFRQDPATYARSVLEQPGQ